MSVNRLDSPDTKRQALAWLVLIGWFSLCVFIFWWYQYRYISPFNEYWASFTGDVLLSSQVKPHQARALVVHFVDPDCPCSRFSVPHIQQLEVESSGGVEFVDFLSSAETDERMQQFKSSAIPAGPAVAVFNQGGDLAYFGPYSSGAICGEGDDLVTATLSSLDQDINPRWINQEAVGCFCRWPTNDHIGV